jgi:hypothetical protein
MHHSLQCAWWTRPGLLHRRIDLKQLDGFRLWYPSLGMSFEKAAMLVSAEGEHARKK